MWAKYPNTQREMSKTKPTLKDVASQANVSVTTASMALTDTGRISGKTKEKVISAAKVLGYRKKDKFEKKEETSSNIAFIIQIDYEWAFVWLFIQPIIRAFEAEIKESGYNVILVPVTGQQTQDEIFQKILSVSPGAVISIHFGDEALFNRIEQINIPVIIVMNGDFQDKFSSICVDDFQGAYEAGLHLIRLGHRRLAYVDIDRPNLPALSSDRFIGFKKAVDENNLPFSEAQIIRFELGKIDRLKKDLEDTFHSSQIVPTAIFCLDDDLAYRIILVLQEMKLSVPNDVSIIAPGDVLDYGRPQTFPITTMRIDTTYIGKLGAQMLVDRLSSQPRERHVIKVKQQLVERGSCLDFKKDPYSRVD
jgi:LacI family transcriptional regulator